jgi:predicted esterase
VIGVHKLAVTRTARYATAGADPDRAAHLWVVLHGYGQRAADFITAFADAAPADVRIVAPEGLSRFYLELPRADGAHLNRTGATWLTRDDRDDDLTDVLAMLHTVIARESDAIAQARGSAPTLHLLGFSQGVAMSMRLVADSTGTTPRFATHVLWAGGLAHDVPDEALQGAWAGTAVHLVMGKRDRFISDKAVQATRNRLSAIGVTATEHMFDGGHRLHTPLLEQLMTTRPRR